MELYLRASVSVDGGILRQEQLVDDGAVESQDTEYEKPERRTTDIRMWTTVSWIYTIVYHVEYFRS